MKKTNNEINFGEYEIKFVRTRNVKPIEKAHADDAGIDFYVPTNLNITDFTKNIGIYLNTYTINKNQYSPSFQLKNIKDGRELWIKFGLDKTTNEIYYINLNRGNGVRISPEWNSWFESKDTVVVSIDLEPGEKLLIPSGIHVKLPPNIYLDGQNKSGIASKRNLYIGAATIDNGYQGEIHINMTNVGNTTVIINADDKIAQFLPHFMPVINKFTEFNSTEELYSNIESTRGEGGFGSTTKSDSNIISTSINNNKEIENSK